MTAEQEMAAAKITGTAERYTLGIDRDTPREQALAELHEISRDPVVFGHVLGDVIMSCETESTGYQVVVDLLRAAGADEATAAEQVEWLRWRQTTRGSAPWF